MTGVSDGTGSVAGPAGHHGTRSEMSGSAGNMVQARDISGGVHFHFSPVAARPRPAQLPGEARGFVNRARELAGLDAAIGDIADTEASRPRLALIVGTAGVGKTSLAVHLISLLFFTARASSSRFLSGQAGRYLAVHGESRGHHWGPKWPPTGSFPWPLSLVPVRRPKGQSEQALHTDTRTTNTLIRAIRALGERAAAEFKHAGAPSNASPSALAG